MPEQDELKSELEVGIGVATLKVSLQDFVGVVRRDEKLLMVLCSRG
jgi:hypothetical protein